nr:uncharacterized protein LOC123763661 isoform X1 [Procambarus clarkii]
MVRVGGGWDTLEHYLDKHDPCRCRQGHRVAVGSRVGFKTSTSGQERQLMNVTYERKKTGGQIISVQSSRDRVTIQQIPEKFKMEVPPPFPVQESIKISSSVPEVQFLEGERENPVTMLENLINQNEKDSFPEVSFKHDKVEHFTANLQSPVSSEAKLTPQVLTGSVKICGNSVEQLLKEKPVASSLQNEVVTMKNYHLLSPKPMQKAKINSEITRSSLPVISEIKCQTTRGRTATECYSKENLPDKISTSRVEQSSNNNTIYNSSKNCLNSLLKCKRTQSLENDEMSGRNYLYEIEETGLKWTEGNAFSKIEGEKINATRENMLAIIPKKCPLQTLETDLTCPAKENVNFQCKKEIETGISQKLPLSRIPKSFQRVHVVSHQDYEKSRTAPVSSDAKLLKTPNKNENSHPSKKGKLINPLKKGSPEHAAKKGLMEISSKKEILLKNPQTDSQKIHPQFGNLHNHETTSQGTFQKSQRVGKQYHSIKYGQPQNSSNKTLQCSPQKRSAHSSMTKGLSQHSTSNRKHTTQNVAGTKIPIHIHSLKETLHKSSDKKVTQSVSEKAFGIQPKKGPTPHRIPVSKELMGRPSHMASVTEISCQLNNINFANRETLQESNISAPTLDIDIQQESVQNTFSAQQPDDLFVCKGHIQCMDIHKESIQNTFSKQLKDKFVCKDQVQNATPKSYKHTMHKPKNGYRDTDKDELDLSVAMNKNITKQYATDKDIIEVAAVTKVLGTIQQDIGKESESANQVQCSSYECL